jgi:hypothetical protein
LPRPKVATDNDLATDKLLDWYERVLPDGIKFPEVPEVDFNPTAWLVSSLGQGCIDNLRDAQVDIGKLSERDSLLYWNLNLC